MNAQERDLLQSFLREVSQARPAQKDPVAESMIRLALGANPDALYLLAQRALGAEVALQREAKKLQPRAQSSKPANPGLGSFLGTATGVAAGVVAGGFLLEGIQSALRDTGLEESFSQSLEGLGDITDWV